MSDWVLLAVYIVGWFVTVRLIHRSIAKDPESEDVERVLVPIVGAFLWPWIVFFGVPILLIVGAYKLATVPLPQWHLPWQRRQADQERIQELERALGINQEVR